MWEELTKATPTWNFYKTSVPVEGNQLIYSQHLARASERKMNSVESLNEAAFAEQAHSQR